MPSYRPNYRPGSFQSTPPHGRRRGGASRRRSQHGFNPRLRTGGDRDPSSWMAESLVSIHASAREATCHEAPEGGEFDVSIHASAREATARNLSPPPHRVCFNPRLRTGGDVEVPAAVAASTVSIHASAREAMQTAPSAKSRRVHQFQSTPPRGRRPDAGTTSDTTRASFNPRLRSGGDSKAAQNSCASMRVQSTPPRGRRR